MKRATLAAVALFTALDLRAACVAEPSTELVASLQSQAPALRQNVLRLALESAACAEMRHLVKRSDVVTVIDYSLPSTEPRLFVFDLASRKLLFCELVAHGKNSGNVVPTSFSNEPGSLASSIGLFVTEEPYVGSNGKSLKLRGLEPGVNDLASERAIVLHGAYYVSDEAVRVLGRLGRSSGCPAVRVEVAEELIDAVKGGSAIFAYYPQESWLSASAFLQ